MVWSPQLVRILAGLMISLFVAAMDTTIVGASLPSIARDLGGLPLYPWVFSGYLLTSTTTVPLWGRAADLLGRKRLLMASMGVFIVSSVLCGISPGMPALIAFRTLQGIGAGGLQPLVLTTVGDIVPARQRARMQGLFSGSWATAGILGPIIGATLVSTVGWRWIFDMNLPLGLLAMALIWGYRERVEAGRDGQRIDPRGIVLLTGGIALLLVGLGTGNASGGPVWPAMLAAFLVLGGFLIAERMSASPTVPMDLFRNRTTGPVFAVGVLTGVVQFGIIVYVPLYALRVLGGGPFAAGVVVVPMLLCWGTSAIIAGWSLNRVGYPRLLAVGASLVLAGTAMLASGPAGWGSRWVSASTAVVGFGIGLYSPILLMIVQWAVGWRRRGVATALQQLSRTIGGAIGVSVMGIVLQGFIAGSGGSPLTIELEHGIRMDFALICGVAGVILAIALFLLLAPGPAAGGRQAAVDQGDDSSLPAAGPRGVLGGEDEVTDASRFSEPPSI